MKIINIFLAIIAAIFVIMLILLKMGYIGGKGSELLIYCLAILFFIANLAGALLSKRINYRISHIDFDKNPKTFYFVFIFDIVILIVLICLAVGSCSVIS